MKCLNIHSDSLYLKATPMIPPKQPEFCSTCQRPLPRNVLWNAVTGLLQEYVTQGPWNSLVYILSNSLVYIEMSVFKRTVITVNKHTIHDHTLSHYCHTQPVQVRDHKFKTVLITIGIETWLVRRIKWATLWCITSTKPAPNVQMVHKHPGPVKQQS